MNTPDPVDDPNPIPGGLYTPNISSGQRFFYLYGNRIMVEKFQVHASAYDYWIPEEATFVYIKNINFPYTKNRNHQLLFQGKFVILVESSITNRLFHYAFRLLKTAT
jgi:hypothetical protein